MRKVLLLLGLVACGEATARPDVARSSLERVTMPSSANVQALAAGNRAFAFDLYRQLAAQDGNLVVSPYSASVALAMAYAGARTSTESEMKQTLHFTLEQAPLHEAFNALDLTLSAARPGDDGTPFQLDVDNSIWARRGMTIEPAFLDTLALNCGAPVYLADFGSDPNGARAQINDWVRERTHDRIEELLQEPDITPQTTMVLTDTIYFEAGWSTQFPENNTASAPFTKRDGTLAQVPMMHAVGPFSFFQGDDYQAVGLPYVSGQSLLAILPDPGRLAAVEAALNDDTLAAIDASTERGVSLGFPKLALRTHASLKQALQALGMRAAFTAADFSGIGAEVGFIKDVIQEATLTTSEHGTVAAAATAVIFGRKSAEVVTHSVTFDRPFLYLIRDLQSGTILFMGRVVAPE